MSSAVCLNLDQSEILSSGNELRWGLWIIFDKYGSRPNVADILNMSKMLRFVFAWEKNNMGKEKMLSLLFTSYANFGLFQVSGK